MSKRVTNSRRRKGIAARSFKNFRHGAFRLRGVKAQPKKRGKVVSA